MEVLDCEWPPWLRPGRTASWFYFQILKDGSFRVRVDSTFSDSHPQEMGVPLGGVLSVALFSVKISSIAQCLGPGVGCSLYVDGFRICCG